MVKTTKPLAKRLLFAVVFGVLMAALVVVPAYADDYGGGNASYNNNPVTGGNGSTTVTWDIQFAPDMSPASNPQRSMEVGSSDAHIQTHYPYFGDGDMDWWYNTYCASVGGTAAAGMDCLSYWMVAVYDWGRPPTNVFDPTNQAAGFNQAAYESWLNNAVLAHKNAGNYWYWSQHQILYAGPHINTDNYTIVETQPSDFWYAVPPTANGCYGGGSGWNYHANAAWPAGLNRINVDARPTGGYGQTAQYKIDVRLDVTPGSEAWGHVYWITIVGVSGREKVVYSTAKAIWPFYSDTDTVTPALKFRVNVKPEGHSGKGWIIGHSYMSTQGTIGRWSNTGKPVNLKATLEDATNLRVTDVVIKVVSADTIEKDNITKLHFAYNTPGATVIREGGRVVGYRWTGYDLNALNPEITFYYTETENTTFSIDFYGVGTGLADGKELRGHVGYTLIVGGTRLVDY